MRTRKPRNFKRETGQWTWLNIDAVLTIHGTTALPLLALLVALAGKNHRIVTHTQSLATRLCVNRRTIQLAYRRLEMHSYIAREYEHGTGRVTISIHPSAYPPPFVKTVNAKPWPVMPTVNIPAQIARQRKQAAARDLALYRALDAKIDTPVKTLCTYKDDRSGAQEEALGKRHGHLDSIRRERFRRLGISL